MPLPFFPFPKQSDPVTFFSRFPSAGPVRTDLAAEAAAGCGELPASVRVSEEKRGALSVMRMVIGSDEDAKLLGKPRGSYITLFAPPLSASLEDSGALVQLLSQELSPLLPDGEILVIGLGNTGITPDALGPQTAAGILSTRHIGRQLADSVGMPPLRPVSVIAPGVLGQTGIEAGEIAADLVRAISPAAVIAVDALAALSPDRLGCTLQITDSGICPGSGVGNHRAELSERTLGIRTVAIGVPTVVDAAALIEGMTGQSFSSDEPPMIVTPREIDTLIERAAEILSLGINRALQPALSAEELRLLTR